MIFFCDPVYYEILRVMLTDSPPDMFQENAPFKIP